MTSLLVPVVLLAALAAPVDSAAPQEIRYNGAIHKVGRADDVIVKRFGVYYLLSPQIEGARQMVYVVNERGAGGWAWPERYGSIGLDAKGDATHTKRPRLLFDYNGVPSPVTLTLPQFSKDIELKVGQKWIEGEDAKSKNREVWEVTGRKKVQDRECWQVEVKNNFGRKRTLCIDVKSPLVVSLEERFFVGQGDEHRVTLQLVEAPALTEKEYAAKRRPVQALLKLQADLKRADGETRPEMTAAQLKAAATALQLSLLKEAADTPFSELVSSVQRDVESQRSRGQEITRLADQYVGKTAPKYSLQDLQKQAIPAADRQGKIVVLHFWEYQGEPLVEPYGQVGYLDFLYEKRRKVGVQVYGVAVDGRVGDPQFAPAALRSINKLKSTMNLSYPITLDDGKLLEKFGDPRTVGAKLPLWVVIGPDGKVAHYHSGYYKINPDEGLQELDAALVPLIRARLKTATQ